MDSIDPKNSRASRPSAKSHFPDFSEQGYQIERELGHNKSGGRVTYRATSALTQQPVAIKQFQFAKFGTSWSDYLDHEREIELLQQLDSPSIPQYLDSFETKEGFCLVQEYKQAPNLAEQSFFTPQEIKQIAVAILEVLVYLQQQVPPVIHRDIKPENILVDRQEFKVYLVDFGLARIGGEEMGVSSVVKGTLGFMPPEQMFNRPISKASDLYSLGATLICLLTQTRSSEIGNLIDEAYRINFKRLVPHLSPQFIEWLEKMVAPSLKNRYPDATTALNALLPIDVVGCATTPVRRISAENLRAIATQVLLLNIALVSVVSTGLIIPRSPVKVQPILIENPGDALRQLQSTHQCLGCNLRGADLRGINLRGVNLTNANLTDADLRDADLRSAYLESVDLTNADLRGADLRGTYLQGANLSSADIRDTNFKSADLRGVIMPNGFLNP
ncbi:MAG: pentapeptide repeat-containing protein [Aphanothece sp. CMT-3BRIN-NPC111]|jgi:serine/threonine protein kinase|nr:pentapeptide repeat-containing protein [Aphanothece sp. CMT-3BRIN-NPC111]